MMPITSRLDKFNAFMIDILFPNRCPFCGGFIRWDGLVCAECREKLTDANGVICRKCGETPCVCGKKSFEYDMVFGSFFFDEENVGGAVYGFKRTGGENLAAAAAEDMYRRMKREGIPKQDIVVPVPMGRKKRRKRGHNQAEIFAECIGKRLGIPVRNDILYKYDTSDEQHLHGAKERSERVKGLFYAKAADLTGMRVIICDDVKTTGATVSECAGLLKALGAETVIAAVCAVTRLDGEKNISEEGA